MEVLPTADGPATPIWGLISKPCEALRFCHAVLNMMELYRWLDFECAQPCRLAPCQQWFAISPASQSREVGAGEFAPYVRPPMSDYAHPLWSLCIPAEKPQQHLWSFAHSRALRDPAYDEVSDTNLQQTPWPEIALPLSWMFYDFSLKEHGALPKSAVFASATIGLVAKTHVFCHGFRPQLHSV